MRNVFYLVLLLSIFGANDTFAQVEQEPLPAPDARVLDDAQWKQLDASVERGLAWLATQQKEDGSFRSIAVSYTHLTLPTIYSV